MALTRVERERIVDSRLRIQTVATTLKDVGPEKVPDLDEIQKCLDSAEKSLTHALRKD
ncbi:MAG TPA: hypothetical protein VKU19_42190 [Bryobacteraceae bacterium]|nr:hypothetical protein [Bryobacteraceae bacterium]